MNVHIDAALRQEIKARRARLGLVQPEIPTVPIYRVRPAFEVPADISQTDAPEYFDKLLEPEKKLIFKPRLVKSKYPRVEDIIQAVAFDYNLGRNEILSRCRCKEVIIPRHIVGYLARMMTPLSFPEIGRQMDGRDHTTVMHSWRRIRSAIKDDDELRDRVANIMLRIKDGLGLYGDQA